MEEIRAILSSYFDWFYFPSIGLNDILDILIVAFLIYLILSWIKETRAQNLLKGMGILFFLIALAYILKLNTILFITQNALSVGILALFILFQPELRRVLDELGRNELVNNLFRNSKSEDKRLSDRTIYELVKGAMAMGRQKTGALIVIERNTPLGEYMSTGIELDAAISSQLLVNIFEKNTPLHDGAVIIRNNRIVSATCYLPLTERKDLNKELGTRHRAGLGISEVSDSCTIIVSEETGRISVAYKGAMNRNMSENALRDFLEDLDNIDSDMKLRRVKGVKSNEA